MKKTFKLLTVFSLLAASFTFVDTISAQGATNANTTIEVEVTDDNKPLDPSNPPTDPTDPSDPGVIDPEGDDQSIPNENIGDAKLAIWRIPTEMKFKGQYDPVLDLELDLEVSEGKINRRVLSVADVRKGATEWQLTSKLVDMKENTATEANTKLNNNTKLSMSAAAKKHKVDGKHVYAKEFIDEDNGVEMAQEIEISSIENSVAKASNGNGKGYTGLIFDDIKLNIKGGNVDSTNYTGQINWILSDTIQ